jgi:hypothetical protein
MKKYKFLFYIILLSFFCQAQTLLKQPTISSSAVNANGESVIISGTVGQTFVGESESNSTVLSAGFWGSVASVLLSVDDVIPTEFAISSAYPNPFNPTVNIDFSIPEESIVYIKIFDLLGRNIFNHEENFKAPGKYRFRWHGMNDSGASIASGIYLVAIQHKTKFYKQKITFLK